MRDLVFYDFEFNRLGDFPEFVSLNFEKNYCGYGKAEIHYSIKNHDLIRILEENPYLFFVADGNAAIVSGYKLAEDIAIFARTPEWLLTKRAVKTAQKISGTAEEIARELVLTAAGDLLELGEIKGLGSEAEYSSEEMKDLHAAVEEVLRPAALGFGVLVDCLEKRFVFEVFEGKETKCVLSLSNRTAFDMVYTEDRQTAASGAWYKQRICNMGDWDALENSPLLADGTSQNAYTFYKISSETYDKNGEAVRRFDFWCPKGWYLYSDTKDGKWKVTNIKPDTTWVYLENPDAGDGLRFEAVLDGVLTEDEALAKLKELALERTLESETRNMEYGKDFCLGDVVDTQFELGDFRRIEKKRVETVNIYFDTESSGVIPILKNLEG